MAVLSVCFSYFRFLIKASGLKMERLYQLEEVIEELPFMRISKSMIVNIEKILHISPALGGRFEALLENDEKVIISRLYVPILKNRLGVR